MTVDYLLLCDDVKETANGAPVVVGVFDELAHWQLPMRTSSIWIFARLRAQPGVITPVYVAFVKPDGSGHTLSNHQLEVRHPRGYQYWWLELRDLEFSHPGQYLIQLHVNRQAIASTDLFVTQLPAMPGRAQ